MDNTGKTVLRFIWKNFLENGFMKKMVSGGDDGEKIAESFSNIKKRNKFMIYNFSYALCEVLNILSVLFSFHILNHLLNGMFWTYGRDVSQFLSLSEKMQAKSVDPMCSVFPTEVACNVKTGSIGGGANDIQSHLWWQLLVWWTSSLTSHEQTWRGGRWRWWPWPPPPGCCRCTPCSWLA